jgi:hypothetical protein
MIFDFKSSVKMLKRAGSFKTIFASVAIMSLHQNLIQADYTHNLKISQRRFYIPP